MMMNIFLSFDFLFCLVMNTCKRTFFLKENQIALGFIPMNTLHLSHPNNTCIRPLIQHLLTCNIFLFLWHVQPKNYSNLHHILDSSLWIKHLIPQLSLTNFPQIQSQPLPGGPVLTSLCSDRLDTGLFKPLQTNLPHNICFWRGPVRGKRVKGITVFHPDPTYHFYVVLETYDWFMCQWLNVLPAAGVQKSENTLKIWASNSDLNLEQRFKRLNNFILFKYKIIRKYWVTYSNKQISYIIWTSFAN